MKTMQNRRFTTNFDLYECIEATLPQEAVKLNWQNIDEMDIDLFERLCHSIQALRNAMNLQFRTSNGGREIGLAITSGFRCKAWELLRKRSGESQHCIGAAVDVQPINCSPELAVEIMQFYFKKYQPRNGGWFGGFAIKRHTVRNGNIETIGFLHFDLRGFTARWEY